MPAHRNHTSKRSQASGEKEHKKKSKKIGQFQSSSRTKITRTKPKTKSKELACKMIARSITTLPVHEIQRSIRRLCRLCRKPLLIFHFIQHQQNTQQQQPQQHAACSQDKARKRGISKSWPRREQVHIRCSDCSQMA